MSRLLKKTIKWKFLFAKKKIRLKHYLNYNNYNILKKISYQLQNNDEKYNDGLVINRIVTWMSTYSCKKLYGNSKNIILWGREKNTFELLSI